VVGRSFGGKEEAKKGMQKNCDKKRGGGAKAKMVNKSFTNGPSW